jgi:hypothetical protein
MGGAEEEGPRAVVNYSIKVFRPAYVPAEDADRLGERSLNVDLAWIE